jgi:hypothetical protein
MREKAKNIKIRESNMFDVMLCYAMLGVYFLDAI